VEIVADDMPFLVDSLDGDHRPRSRGQGHGNGEAIGEQLRRSQSVHDVACYRSCGRWPLRDPGGDLRAWPVASVMRVQSFNFAFAGGGNTDANGHNWHRPDHLDLVLRAWRTTHANDQN
jgi:hypothetical protein